MSAEPGRLDAETRSLLLRECRRACDGRWFLKSATVFFPAERLAWTREAGRPDGDPACRYRFRLLPAGG